MKMDGVPGQLIYKLSDFLNLDSLLVIELLSSTIRNKMIGTISAYHRRLRHYDIQTQENISSCKEYVQDIRSTNSRLVVISPNSSKIVIYNPRRSEWPLFEIKGLNSSWKEKPSPFGQRMDELGYSQVGARPGSIRVLQQNQNWIFIRPDQVLFTGGGQFRSCEQDYFIVELKYGEVTTKGQMIHPRSGHGITKIANTVYVVFGVQRQSSIERYEIFNEQWALVKEDFPKASLKGVTCAASVKSMIFITVKDSTWLYTFSTQTRAFERIDIRLRGDDYKSMIPHEDSLYLIEKRCIYKLDSKGNILEEDKKYKGLGHLMKQNAIFYNGLFYFTSDNKKIYKADLLTDVKSIKVAKNLQNLF